jgi:hypothetical protein
MANSIKIGPKMLLFRDYYVCFRYRDRVNEQAIRMLLMFIFTYLKFICSSRQQGVSYVRKTGFKKNVHVDQKSKNTKGGSEKPR